MAWNVFRFLADISHLASICILIWAIHKNQSAEGKCQGLWNQDKTFHDRGESGVGEADSGVAYLGVSLLTQILYALVFVTRYLDLFNSNTWSFANYGASVIWNACFKLFFLGSAFYTIFVMMKVFPRTRERERAWKLGIYSVIGSLVLAPISIAALEPDELSHWFLEFLWAFSIILESVCVLPQLLLLRQTTVPTVIDSYYLVALGSYRAFYILNWLVRGFGAEKHWDPIAFIFGIVQTAFYVDFAWVYYSRQRVKLRNGGVVDSEDFRKSWLVNRVINFRGGRASTDEEEQFHGESGNEGLAAGGNNRWGARGISIAADDTLEQHGRYGHDEDEDALEGVLEDDPLDPAAGRRARS
ncbi:hypothetical protein N7462_000869 [Penicillium macrosclerotiorum]|uniref:uncharacterized protein n=1 Tax=Penicillium macrosclerotiorum TaxID=303699 RepID=UPI00254985F1|nr:uncharacterized protein N7462_000869 [Penicillium macrosclerotiorum]KAJ5698864.1 hypothetical protein N7462_000869 [Penicillium macrosclerotiorum]